MMKFAAAALALLAAASSARAGPLVRPVSDIVVAPSVTAPTTGSVWLVGSNQTVAWDVGQIPPQAQNNTGLVLLGHTEPGSASENLDIKHPLASGFRLQDGSVPVVAPNVTDGTRYFVVLFGDSGNKSPDFTIRA